MITDGLKCRLYSIWDFVTGKSDKYMIFDDNNNLYIRGRKIRAIKNSVPFEKRDDYYLHLTKPDGTKFYLKKRD